MIRPHWHRPHWHCIPWLLAMAILLDVAPSAAQDAPPAKPDPPPAAAPTPKAEEPKDERSSAAELDKVEGLKRILRDYDVWIDLKRKLVIAEGYVCLREGALEMFACPTGTKEHESIVALNCKAFHIHAALVAVGAKPVHPVKFDPEYVPAQGTSVKIDVLWRDREGKNRRVSARKWVKDHKTGKLLEHDWVFGGSQFWKEPGSPKELYLAEDGDLICVSNFTTATLDLPIESSAEAEDVLFVANTPEIPALKTRVRLVLTPVLKAKAAKDAPQK